MPRNSAMGFHRFQIFCAAVTGVICLTTANGMAAAHATDCSPSSFPVNASNYQYLGLTRAANASNATACAWACCAMGPSCQVWQWAAGGDAAPMHSCWIGSARGTPNSQSGWQSFGRGFTPPAPPVPPPAGPYPIDDSVGLGMRFDGVGAISGGGATSKLLMDYDPDVASDILDYLFLPNFGASLHMLKVEIGGDADATEGAEPSHRHFKEDVGNFERGYEWWMMTEARKRNPNIKLYGLPWSFPGFLGNGSSHDFPSTNPFTDINATAEYVTEWATGALTHHNTRVDYVGEWNERSSPQSYVDALRAHLDAAGFDDVQIASGPHYPGTGLSPQDCDQYEWDESRWTDEEGSVADGQSARCLARCINRGYLTNCRNALIQWHLISSFADYLPWPRCGVAVANRPWSGSYEITSPTWSVAHTTQFTAPGWRYLKVGSGQGFLQHGGSYASYTDTNGQYTIVVEKMDHQHSMCARGNNPPYDTASEEVTLLLQGGLSKIKQMQVWFSDLSDGNNSTQLFVNNGTIDTSNGMIVQEVCVNCIITFTTVTTGNKGAHTIPPDSPFPLPYKDSFDDQSESAPPKYFYDQMGAFEVQQSNDTARGMIVRAVVPDFPICWGYSCAGPTTYLGDMSWPAANLSIDVKLEDTGSFEILAAGSTSDTARVTLSTSGTYTIDTMFGKVGGGGIHFKSHTWYTVKLSLWPKGVVVYLNGAVLDGITSKTPSPLANGWYAKFSLSRYIFAQLDNVSVEPL